MTDAALATQSTPMEIDNVTIDSKSSTDIVKSPTKKRTRNGEKKTSSKRQKGDDAKDATPSEPVVHRFAQVPQPWQTRSLNRGYGNDRTRFVIRLSDGLICQNWRDVYEGKEVPFPSTLAFKNGDQNLKRAQPLLKFINDGHTAKANAGMSRSKHGVEHDKQTHIFLQFGMTVAEDQEYLPKYLAEQEKARRDEIADKKIRDVQWMFREQPERTNWMEPAKPVIIKDPKIEDVEAQMTAEALETWKKWEQEAIEKARKETLRTFVDSRVFATLMHK